MCGRTVFSQPRTTSTPEPLYTGDGIGPRTLTASS